MEINVDTIINYVYCAGNGAFEFAADYMGDNTVDLSAQYYAFTEMVSDGLLKDVVVVDVDDNEYTMEEFAKSGINFDQVREVNPIKF
ncbi:hypothetical protein ACTQ2Q_07400 [Atopobiaceae bacterium LCP21S3_F11]